MTTKPEYIFPRIGILNIHKITNHQTLLLNIQAYHGKYFQLFNLTNTSIMNQEKAKEHETKFKWRGAPFSLSEGVKILNRLDSYLRTNQGNSVIFCVNCDQAYLYSQVLIREYVRIINWGIGWDKNNVKLHQRLNSCSASITQQQPEFSQAFFQTYQNKQISLPPVKMICSLQISTPDFIPLFQIYQEARYNDFEMIYSHQVTNQLAEYYFNLNKPLQEDRKSTGNKFYDRKPETKYLIKPVSVCGDVKVVCYSYNTLEKKKQFSFGFNTKQLIFTEEFGENEGILTFKYKDLFDRSPNSTENFSRDNLKLFDENIEVYIKIQNSCLQEACGRESKCEDCQEQCKKLNLRYNEAQGELNKLYRERTAQQIVQQLSLF